MAEQIKDGGPAYPTNKAQQAGGMSLRDRYAIEAMKEMDWQDNDVCARECYAIADSMLRAREVKGNGNE